MRIAAFLLLAAMAVNAAPQDPLKSSSSSSQPIVGTRAGDIKCKSSDDCPAESFCENRTILSDICVPRKVDTESCSVDRECQSNVCDSIDKKCFPQRRALNQICNASPDCLAGLYCARQLPLEENRNMTALKESGESQLKNNGTAKSLIDFTVNRGSATLDDILEPVGVHFHKVANQSLFLSSTGFGLCSYPMKFGDFCNSSDECASGLACVMSVCVIDAAAFANPHLNAWATLGMCLAATFFSLVLVPMVICGVFGWGCFGRGKDRAYPDSTFTGPSMSQRSTM